MKRLLAVAVIMLFLFYPLRFAVRGFGRDIDSIMNSKIDIHSSYGDLFEVMEGVKQDHAVIASDPKTSYLVSAFTDHFVTVVLDQHCSPADTLALERLEAVKELFSPGVPLAGSIGWLSDSGADYVLLNADMGENADFYGTTLPADAILTYEKLASCRGVLREVAAVGRFRLFEVNRDGLGGGLDRRCREPFAYPVRCRAEGVPGERITVYEDGIDAGCGMALRRLQLVKTEFQPGDTLRGWFCWTVTDRIGFGQPVEWTLRLDTDYPRGSFYRDWYSKQYRRRIERRNRKLYRFTVSERLASGLSYPEGWDAGEDVLQSFSFRLPEWMAPGTYELRLKVRRIPYLPNRRLLDYFINEDSLHGDYVTVIKIAGRGGT